MRREENSECRKKVTTSLLVKNTDYNAKITEIENKVPSDTGLTLVPSATASFNAKPKSLRKTLIPQVLLLLLNLID